jgi:hypothetical protein
MLATGRRAHLFSHVVENLENPDQTIATRARFALQRTKKMLGEETITSAIKNN